MADFEISQLASKGAPGAGDLFVLVDVSDLATPPAGAAGSNKNMTYANLTAGLVNITTNQTIAGNKTFSGATVVAAGTTVLAPLTFQSGTNLTTAAAGAAEFDGKAFYLTAAASSRQVVNTVQFTNLSGTFTLTNTTSAQQLFNATANGALTVQASTTYEFECEFDITGLSASTHTVQFLFGGTATFTSLKYVADSNTGAQGTLAAWQTLVSTVATATSLMAAGTTTTFQARLRGTLRINAGGTIIPQIIQLTASAAAVVGANSFFRIWPVGSNVVTNVGNWS